MLGLQDFPGTNRVRRHRHAAADFRSGKARRQFQCLGKQAIAKQHGDFVAPIGRQRGPVAADLRLVHHIVMHQRRQMYHFNDDRRRHVRISDFAQGAGGQRHDGRAQMLSAAVQGVLGVRNDLRIKIIDLPDQLARDRLQKRFHRFHDVLPGTFRIGDRRATGIRTRHL